MKDLSMSNLRTHAYRTGPAEAARMVPFQQVEGYFVTGYPTEGWSGPNAITSCAKFVRLIVGMP